MVTIVGFMWVCSLWLFNSMMWSILVRSNLVSTIKKRQSFYFFRKIHIIEKIHFFWPDIVIPVLTGRAFSKCQVADDGRSKCRIRADNLLHCVWCITCPVRTAEMRTILTVRYTITACDHANARRNAAVKSWSFKYDATARDSVLYAFNAVPENQSWNYHSVEIRRRRHIFFNHSYFDFQLLLRLFSDVMNSKAIMPTAPHGTCHMNHALFLFWLTYDFLHEKLPSRTLQTIFVSLVLYLLTVKFWMSILSPSPISCSQTRISIASTVTEIKYTISGARTWHPSACKEFPETKPLNWFTFEMFLLTRRLILKRFVWILYTHIF